MEKSAKRPKPIPPRYWLLHDAKTHLSELVRRVRIEGSQHVTVRGRDEVVVIAVEEFRRLRGQSTGKQLIDVLHASPHRDIDLTPVRLPMPVRDVSPCLNNAFCRSAKM